MFFVEKKGKKIKSLCIYLKYKRNYGTRKAKKIRSNSSNILEFLDDLFDEAREIKDVSQHQI